MKNDTKIILKLAAKALLVAALTAMSLYNLLHDTNICVKSETIYFSSVAEDDDFIVNINTANIRELQKLNGIGRATAQAIIDYRNRNGDFTSIDELINVKGIGKVKLEKIRDHVTV